MNVNEYLDNCFKDNTLYSYLDNIPDNKTFDKFEILTNLLDRLNDEYKFKITKFNLNKKGYPQYMLLSGDKGILAYLKFIVVQTKEFKTDSICSNLELVKDLICRAESELDRPVFIIYVLASKNNNGIYFETNEQIKDRLFFYKKAIYIFNNRKILK